MALSFAEGVEHKEFRAAQSFCVEHVIVTGEHNNRWGAAEKFDHLKDLIRENGQKVPGIVFKNTDGFPVLIAGRNRLEALRQLNKEDGGTRQFVAVVEARVNEESAFWLSVDENTSSSQLSPMDYAAIMDKAIKKYGATTETLAKRFDKSSAWVTTTLDNLKHDKATQQAIHEGRLAPNQARELLKVSSESERAELIAPVLEDMQSGVPVSQARRVSKDDVKKGVEQKTGKSSGSNSMAAVKKTFQFIADNEEGKFSKQAVSLSKAFLNYASGETTEPGFFGLIKRLSPKTD